MSSPMPVTLLAWRPLARNTLRGFASIRLGSALKIHDIAVHKHDNGKSWASMPSKPIMMQDGTQKIGDNGKPMYAPILEWNDRGASDRFSESVIAALEAEHPGATG